MLAGELIEHRFVQSDYWQMKKQQLRRESAVPSWLIKSEENPDFFIRNHFMGKTYLQQSCVYGASGDDERILKWTGLYHSLLMVDFNYEPYWIQNYIKPFALKGYECYYSTSVTVLPVEEVTIIQEEIAQKLEGKRLTLKNWDLVERASKQDILDALSRETPKSGSFVAYVYLLKRLPEYDDSHGPPLLCLTLLSAGICTAFYWLFTRQQIACKCISSHNPGMYDVIYLNQPHSIFRAILRLSKKSLPPLYMFQPAFSEYDEVVYDNPDDKETPSLWALDWKLRPKARNRNLRL